MKVKCVIPDRARRSELHHRSWRTDGRFRCVFWEKTLPFLLNPRGHLVHRVQFATSTFSEPGVWDHDTAHYWCKNIARGQFLAVPPEGRLLCAHCERIAVANGQPTADEIAGRHVHIGTLKAHRLCCRDDQN